MRLCIEVTVLTSADIMLNAKKAGVMIPAFNVPHLPMVEPIIRAVVDQDSFALIETARPEWAGDPARGVAAVKQEFDRWCNLDYVRLHLDHVPVIDENQERVDYLPIIQSAIDLGFQSVMIDGSRLELEENIAATRQVAEIAHKAGIPCEAELGRVLGHEAGPPPPYEELYESGLGFTDVEEASRFVRETGCDWLSVAIGNIHGSISEALKDRKKVQAKLNLDHLEKLNQAVGVPLVLHGGSGIQQQYVLAAIQRGIAKMNIGTDIRQAYEAALKELGSVAKAQEAVYERTTWILRDYLCVSGSRKLVAY
jgi:fructose-bisphosphate aldolase class II